MPAAEMGLARLRTMARQTMIAAVRLYTVAESHAAGARPVKDWTPEPEDRIGKYIVPREGGPSTRADQEGDLGDGVLVMEPDTPLQAGMRATVVWTDQRQRVIKKAVELRRVLPPTPHEITRRAVATEISGWWPDA